MNENQVVDAIVAETSDQIGTEVAQELATQGGATIGQKIGYAMIGGLISLASVFGIQKIIAAKHRKQYSSVEVMENEPVEETEE